MIACLGSSFRLHVVLGQRGRPRKWRSNREGVASALVEVERQRTLDRLRLRAGTEDEAPALAARASSFRVVGA